MLLRGENDSKQSDEIQAIPGWDWKNHLVKKCNYPGLHYQDGDILDDKSLVQLVEEPTRQQNTFDLAITNQPITIRDVSIVKGVSDHDCPLITLHLKPVRCKQTPQKIPLYKRARDRAGTVWLINYM